MDERKWRIEDYLEVPDGNAEERLDAAGLRMRAVQAMFVDMSDAPSRAEIEAKLEAVEARADTKFAQVLARLDHLPTTGALWAAAATTIISIVGIMLAILTFGSQWFGLGMDASSAAQAGADRALAAYVASHPAPPSAAPIKP